MNKFTKVCLIIVLVLVCTAAVCLGAGAALGSSLKEVQTLADNGELSIGSLNIGKHKFYFGSMDDEDFDKLPVEKGKISRKFPAEGIKELELEIQYGEINIVDSDSDNIEIEVDAPKRNSYSCEEEEGTLSLEDTTSGYKVSMVKNNVFITIAIPKGKTFHTVEVNTNAGKIDIKHELSANYMTIQADAGEVRAKNLNAAEQMIINVDAGSAEVSNFKAGELDADCGMGEIILTGKTAGDISAECGMGSINLALYGKETDYNYEITCGIGTVKVNQDTFSGLSREVSVDHEADRELELDCGIGEINVTIEPESM